VLSPEKEDVFKRYAKIVDGWKKAWNWHLDEFALMALDLANNPGKNSTHWHAFHLTYPIG
jgi:hypothetical protein